MPAPPDLRRLVVGDRIQAPLLVLDVEQRDTSRGPFTSLILSNCYGQLTTGPFWVEDLPRIAGIGRGDVVQIAGEVTQHNGRRQLKVGSIRTLHRGSVDWRQLLPSVSEVGPYWNVLDKWRAEMHRPRLASTLNLFFDDPEFRQRFEECPASVQGHHAELGGLLRHTCEVATIGRAIAAISHADLEMVFAGALLHDIGKLDAYSWEGVFEHTECGSLLGHVTLGILMLDRRVGEEDLPQCTEMELTLLHHLVASHHGKLEFGAAVPPMTLEAEVLHFADNASAKTASMTEALADPDNFVGKKSVSARTIWQLDRRRVYRGGSDWGMTAENGER